MRARESGILKFTAGFFAILMLICCVASIALSIGAYALQFPTTSYAYIEGDVLRFMVEDHLRDVYETYQRGDDPKTVYARTNLRFRILVEEGEVMRSSAGFDPGVSVYTRQYSRKFYDMTDYAETTAVGDAVADPPPPEVRIEQHTLEGYVDRALGYTDRYSAAIILLDLYYESYRILPLIALGFGIAWLILLIWLLRAAGHHRDTEGVRRGWGEYIPFDLLTLGVLCLIPMHELIFSGGETEALIFGGAFLLMDAVVLTLYLCTLAVRLKTHTLLKTTLIWQVLRLVWRVLCFVSRGLGRIAHALPLIPKTVGILLLDGFLSLILVLAIGSGNGVILLWILKSILVAVAVLYCATLMRRIQRGGEHLAAGELSAKIDTAGMFGDFRQFADTMNRLGDGMSAAVEERMKSERFRTELITNVSHDIKTPLTSIVNYVDLIKKENIQDETLAGYVEVLERQSGRLKKLTEDLIEASRAATGAIAVQTEKMDAGVLLGQAVGEYDAKMKEAGLDLILHRREEPICILADGRLLWRVFDNLLGNIVKYALPGTRVYLTLQARDEAAEIVFRNIARDELHRDSAELLNRFTRGDSARSGEGSGLGLSIAKSLSELQGGQLELCTDGDLFKVTLRFPLAV